MKKELNLLLALLAALSLASCSWINPSTEQKIEQLGLCKLLADSYLSNQANQPFYYQEMVSKTCQQVEKPDSFVAAATGKFYLDEGCKEEFAYYPRNFMLYCESNIMPNDISRKLVGNPAAWPQVIIEQGASPKQTKWTLSQGSRLKLAAIDQTKYLRPFIKEVMYKEVQTSRGKCELGMKIFKQFPSQTDLKPIILIHGGGWKYRGSGATMGNAVTAPNLTTRGYVVFAPFYRLVGNASGPDACNESQGSDIQQDIADALDWVLQHGETYGAKPGVTKIPVMGQSAGAHLSLYLAMHHKDKVEKALLLYPATDFPFFISESKPGGLWPAPADPNKIPAPVDFAMGKGVTVAYVNQPGVTDITQIDLNDPIVQQNAYPEMANQAPTAWPPMYMIQGSLDFVAPVEMTTRMCQGLNPALSPSPKAYKGWDLETDCGPKAKLRIVGGAGHMLDLRCLNQEIGIVVNYLYKNDLLCASGTKEGQAMVIRVLEEAYNDFL